MNNDDSDYESEGLRYNRNKEMIKWLKLRLMEENCNNCCLNIKKIFSLEPRSPVHLFYINTRK